jgi:hypothetical protein
MKNKGKILRVKTGYNPNSSSVGSIIPLFIYLFGIAGVVSVFVINLLQKTDRQITQGKNNLEPVSKPKKL